ncbi:hypothetical protein ABZ519_28775 [Streptomyces collinus]|uniref:hypothetical protein n=1 Tax=Streptomyces collinus TaxID=42684 RepID=UPI0033E70C9E
MTINRPGLPTDRDDVLRTIADEDHGATSARGAHALLAHAEDHRLTPELLMSLTGDLAGRPRDRPAMTRALELVRLDRP